MAREPRTSWDRALDWTVIIVGTASLVMIAYDLNIASLGRRLAGETQLWLAEQTGKAAPSPRKEDESP
jgi:hypothetical protein